MDTLVEDCRPHQYGGFVVLFGCDAAVSEVYEDALKDLDAGSSRPRTAKRDGDPCFRALQDPVGRLVADPGDVTAQHRVLMP
jgi:hypothetical protein